MYRHYYADMGRKSISDVIREIKTLLEKEGELSVRQISLKIKSQWRTVDKALGTMKMLGTVKERMNKDTERIERLVSLKK
jgi:Mn-dependent DtxR family transcriptional regulator